MDSLVEMLRAQRALQIDSFGSDPCTLTGEERVEFIRWNVLALEDELHEMLGEVGWKPWATSRHVSVPEATGELVDAWHFFMNLLLAVTGMDAPNTEESVADTFIGGYFNKRQVNAKRQEDGYDGVTGKCTKCKRDLAEVKLVWYRYREDHTKIMCCPCGQEVPV